MGLTPAKAGMYGARQYKTIMCALFQQAENKQGEIMLFEQVVSARGSRTHAFRDTCGARLYRLTMYASRRRSDVRPCRKIDGSKRIEQEGSCGSARNGSRLGVSQPTLTNAC